MMTEQSEKISTPVSKFVRYNNSIKGYARNRRFNKSDARKKSMDAFMNRNGGKSVYRSMLYRRHQDEAGRHSQLRVFYPGYIILQALQTAEVVEI